MPKREDHVTMDFQRIELAAGAMSKEEQEVDFKRLKQIRNRMKKTDWLFLSACAGEFFFLLSTLHVISAWIRRSVGS